MWTIQINWNGKWVTIDSGIGAAIDAERSIFVMMQRMEAQRNPFRIVHKDDIDNDKVAGASLKTIDSKVSK